MQFILLVVLWVTVGWDNYICNRTIKENVDIVRGHPEMVNRICRGFIKYTDSGQRIDSRHVVLGCFTAGADGRALILWNGNQEVLQHELNHARDHFCN